MKAYRVHNSYITNDTIWSGVVVAEDDEDVSTAIMEHHGLTSLFDEEHLRFRHRNYSVEEIPFESVRLNDLTVGELLKVLKYFTSLGTDCSNVKGSSLTVSEKK